MTTKFVTDCQSIENMIHCVNKAFIAQVAIILTLVLVCMFCIRWWTLKRSIEIRFKKKSEIVRNDNFELFVLPIIVL